MKLVLKFRNALHIAPCLCKCSAHTALFTKLTITTSIDGMPLSFGSKLDVQRSSSDKAYFFPCYFCLFDLILYIPVNNFSVMSGRVFPG